MTVRIRTITVDCRDPYLLAGFWSRVTGFAEDPGNANHPEDPEGLLLAPGAPPVPGGLTPNRAGQLMLTRALMSSPGRSPSVVAVTSISFRSTAPP